MFFYSIILLILLVLLMSIFKRRNLILICSSLVILLFATEFDIQQFIRRFIAILNESIFNNVIIAILLSVALLYFISELLIILGVQNKLDTFILNRGIRTQKIITIVLSSLSTNIDLSKSVMLHRYDKIYNQSLTLTKSLNIISVDFLTLLSVLYVSTSVYGTNISVLLILSNFFAIYFVVKRIIDFKNDVYVDYAFHRDRLNILDTSTEVRNVNYDGFLGLLIRVFIYILGLAALFIFFDLSVYIPIVLLLILIFIDLFISSLRFSYKTKHIKEIQIYQSLFVGLKKIIKPLGFIVVAIFYTEVMMVLFENNLFIFDLSFNPVVLVLLVFAIFASYILYDALLVIILVLPILAVYFTSSYFEISQFGFIAVLFGVSYFANHLSVLKLKKTHKFFYIDVLLNISCATLAYIFLVITNNFIFSYIIVILFLLIYYIISKFFIKGHYEKS